MPAVQNGAFSLPPIGAKAQEPAQDEPSNSITASPAAKPKVKKPSKHRAGASPFLAPPMAAPTQPRQAPQPRPHLAAAPPEENTHVKKSRSIYAAQAEKAAEQAKAARAAAREAAKQGIVTTHAVSHATGACSVLLQEDPSWPDRSREVP